MTNQEQAALRQFIAQANTRGVSNYDWRSEIFEEGDEAFKIRCWDRDESEQSQQEHPFVVELFWHDMEANMMAIRLEEDQQPIVFTALPWVFVSITYSGD